MFLLFFNLCLVAGVFAQGRTITGTVTSAEGLLPGVSVAVKGTNIATATDVNGKFTLSVPAGTPTLVFSYIGFVTKEVPVSSQSAMTVTLMTDNQSLSEVVVVGYGPPVAKEDLTGSIGQVKMSDLGKAPVPTFDQALAGRVAGVQVVSNDGQPGSQSEILIRGVGSLTGSTAPLYVIDGFPQETSGSNNINPADIESIDILKDASATAIYGARGANGVVIITTKRGAEGRPKINYNMFTGKQWMLNRMELMSPYEFVKLQTEINPTYAAGLYLSEGRTLESYRNVEGIDWQDKVFTNAPFANHSLSLSGKSGKTGYYLSGNYVDQEGLIINSGYKRYQGRITLDQEINDKVKVGVTANYSSSRAHGNAASTQTPQVGTSTSTQNNGQFNFLYNVWTYRPVSGTTGDDALVNNLYDDDAANNGEEVRTNPVLAALNEYDARMETALNVNSYLEYRFLKKFRLRITGGFNSFINERESFRNSQTRGGNPAYSQGRTFGPNGGVSTATAMSFLNENTLTYSNLFGEHSVQVTVGHTNQRSTSKGRGFNATFVPNEALGINGLDEGTPYSTTSFASENTLASFLGRVNYDYQKKYYLTVSFRADGSSKFSPDNRWSYFPSAAVSWRFGNEAFMEPFERVITDAKLRASYGITGNNRVSDFPWQDRFGNPVGYRAVFNNQMVMGFGPTQVLNNSLTWEAASMFDAGLELSFFKNKYNLEIDYYKKTTYDLLLGSDMSAVTGFTRITKNIGDISNEGLEITLNTNNFSTNSFTWTTNFNISFNKNRLLGLASGQEIIGTNPGLDAALGNNLWIAKTNQPVAMFYGYISDGLYQVSDFEKVANGYNAQTGETIYQYFLKEGVPTYAGINRNSTAIQPGDVKQKDLNGDGVLDSKDFTNIGNPWPKHIGGLSNNFTYKGFDLNVFFQWSYGNDVFNANRIMMEGQQTPADDRALGRNQFATYADRWSFTNQDGQYPRARANAAGVRAYASRLIEDASYLRLKTIQLGYNFPAELIKRVGIQNLRIYTAAQNLYTWTNYSGPDPEVSTKPGPLTPGFDYSPYPRTRVVTVGANVTF